MRPLLVCGTANAEMVLRLKGKILPTAEGVFSNALGLNVSGVGVNLARGLERLGSPVRLLTLTAHDPVGALVRASLGGIQTRFALTRATP
ncbi:hypothetical protein [Deinococcus arenicola]|uniref:Carbohydrate kinase PfkB domain-containing protein n=1 Tax=Deinococcus arenicola TaxID=2994950 RepID=A0ABU4DM81_9DEIO|nr:hypothetical protein [Deinococcus sp. ZS9-10]MDV6372995.1 hypothetical protein [Deinococcus sp. ZS9-10]